MTNDLAALVSRQAKALRRLGIRRLLRRGRFAFAHQAPAAGRLAVKLTVRRVLARGGRTFAAPAKRVVRVKLTRTGRKRLRRARRLSATLRATFTPRGGTAVTAASGVRLRR